MSFFIIEAILIVVCIFLAKKMVDKRIWFAKRLNIGKDSEANVEKLKQFAENLLSKEIKDSELDGLTINVEIKEGKIVQAKIENEKTQIISSKENGTHYFNRAWSKRGAVGITAFTIWGIALWVHILLTLIWEMYRISLLLPQ